MSPEKIELKEMMKLLISLQEKDSILDQLRLRAKIIPREAEEKKALMAQIRSEMEVKKGQLNQLQLKRKEKELELETKESEIKKHNMELNSVKSNEAYRALLTEIESGKGAKSILENEILEIMEAIDKESVQLKEGDKELKRKEGEFQELIAKLENELKMLNDEIEAKENERNEFAKHLPEATLHHYEYVRESREGQGIAFIEGENCSGCHIALRPQIINDVYKSQDVIVCDSCSRILYKK